MDFPSTLFCIQRSFISYIRGEEATITMLK